MAGFVYLAGNDRDPGFVNRRKRALNAMAQKGLSTPHSLTGDDFELHVFQKMRFGVDNYIEFADGDFVVSTGTFVYRDRAGRHALQAVFDDFIAGGFKFENCLGHYAVWICANGKLYLFNDFRGIYQVYHTNDRKLIANSFVAVHSTLESITPAPQQIFEYLALEQYFGKESIVEEIEVLDRRRIHCLTDAREDEVKTISVEIPQAHSTFAELVDFFSGTLEQYFQTIAGLFGDDISIGLTGGYDSRLILASLRRAGVSPYVYVQGDKSSDDVRVAQLIAKGESIDLLHDTSDNLGNFSPDEFANRLAFGWHYQDALPSSGLFDDWILASTERARIPRAERLRLYGMAGEMFRRTRLMGNQPTYHAMKYVIAQYGVPALAKFGPAFDRHGFFSAIGEKLLHELDITGHRMTREDTEIAYPHFALPRLSGPQITRENTRAHALMPFGEPMFSMASRMIPVRQRYFGRFAAALNTRVDPALAAYTSAYGYAFSEGPGLKLKAIEMAKQLAPKRIRPALRRLRNWRQPAEQRRAYQQTDYLQEIFSGEPWRIQSMIDVDQLTDPRLLSKALTIELVLRGYGR